MAKPERPTGHFMDVIGSFMVGQWHGNIFRVTCLCEGNVENTVELRRFREPNVHMP